MLEFFIALFGGLYYGSKLLNEKKQLKDFDNTYRRITNDMDEDMNRWIAMVVDDNLESETELLIRNTINTPDIYNMISSSLSGFIPEIKSFNDLKRSAYNNPQMLKMILMAQRGKVPKEFARYGFRSPGVFNDAEIERWKRVYNIMLVVDGELKKHGIEPMVFSSGSDADKIRFSSNAKSYAKPVGTVRDPIGGVYYWWSNRRDVRHY